MADRNTLRDDRRGHAADQDPFADLARIIGFDPRVKLQPGGGARPTSSPPRPVAIAVDNSAPASSAASWEDEFSRLDFGLDEEPAPAEAVASAEPELADEPIAPPALEIEPQPVQVAEAVSPSPEELALQSLQTEASFDIIQDLEDVWTQPAALHATEPVIASPAEAQLSSPAPDDIVADQPAEPEAIAEPAESIAEPEEETLAEPESAPLLLDTDLNDVLAASIERDLGDAWLDEESDGPEPVRAVEPHDTEEEPFLAAEHVYDHESPDNRPPQAIELAVPTSEPAAGLHPRTSRFAEEGEGDFENELTEFLLQSDAAAPMPAEAAFADAAEELLEAAVSDSDGEPAALSPVETAEPPVAAQAEPAAEAEEPAEQQPAWEEPARRQHVAAVVAEAPRELPQARKEEWTSRRPLVPLDAPALDDDPFAALAAMAARYRAGQFTAAAKPEPPAPEEPRTEIAEQQTEQNAEVEEMRNAPSARHDAPDIDTVDVPEHAVAVADDLDFPETPYDEAPRAARHDVDAEFADLLDDMSSGEPMRRPARAASYRERPDARFEAPRGPQPAYAPQDYGAYAPSRRQAPEPAAFADEDEWQPQYAAADYPDFDADPFYDDPQSNTIAGEGEEERKPRRRGKWLAALFGSVAIIGAAGAAAMHFTGVAEVGGPILVKADESPIKIRPENPGGVVVPNQENEVYARVAGAASDAPAQEKLLSSAEEPVSLDEPLADETMLPGLDIGEDIEAEPAGKGEERLAEAAPEPAPLAVEEPIAVAPRKVRTMAVRADGTLVAPEEHAPPAVEALVADAGKALAAVGGGSGVDTAGATASVAPDSPVSALSAEPVQKPAVGEASAGSSWSMQIASQPSEAAARSSYADLAQRYSVVLGGRDVNIVKAEVSGKGTFWRVRVPAETRSAAADLCASYKAAGGNCFVSK